MSETETIDPQRFADLGRPRRVWAVASVHGEIDRLLAVHAAIGSDLRPGDRIVYLGNQIGRGPAVRAVVDELLRFRREAIGLPGMLAEDVVYLRGMQEEMWQKLLQLQFAPNPSEVLQWMTGQGVEATLLAYGGSATEGMQSARAGATSIARWTQSLRLAQRSAPGHDAFMTALRRAAFVSGPAGAGAAGLLFVNAGLDPARPLFTQGDRFWWGGGAFGRIDAPYETFRRIVRGYDPGRGGVQVLPFSITLDAGCGAGGPLVAALLDPQGEILDLIEV